MLLNKLRKATSIKRRKKANTKKVEGDRSNETKPATIINMVMPRLGTTTASNI